MKRIIGLFLSMVLLLSLCACGKESIPEAPTEVSTEITQVPITEENETSVKTVEKLVLGETASTDLAEFTLENSTFTYYVSNNTSNLAEPTDTPNDMFAASIGHCYVSLTFTITNKDRGGSISYASTFADWYPNWTVTYGAVDYPVKGYDLNNNAGSDSINLTFSAVIDKNTGKMIEEHGASNYLLQAGETVTLRAFGIIDVDPENLTDAYDFTVGVPKSTGGYEYFTYAVPDRS